MSKKDFLPEIKKALKGNDDELVELFYNIEDETIVGESELSWIIEICSMFNLDFIPFITGKQDIDILHMLDVKMQIDDEVSRLPCKDCSDKSKNKNKIKKDEKGKILVFNPDKSPYNN